MKNNSLLPLSFSKHQKQGWKRHNDFSFASGDSIVPVLQAELPVLVRIFPLAFSDKKEMVALLGKQSGQNLFLDNQSRWLSGYIPSFYRGYPFALKPLPGNQAQLCFDMCSGFYREHPDKAKGEERFFDDNGNMQPLLKDLLTFFTQVLRNQTLTRNAASKLAEHDLLKPYTAAGLKNLYQVDLKRLLKMKGTALEELNSSHAIELAHAQLFSMVNSGVFDKLIKKREQAQEDIQKIFAEDDTFKF